MRSLLLVLLLVGATARAGSAILELAGESPVAAGVLSKSYIHVATTGEVDIAFEQALALLRCTNLLSLVQDAYASTLPPGEEVKFVVRQTSSKSYAYTTQKGLPSVITEVYRGLDEADRLNVVYHVAAKRFFGSFQSVIHVCAFAGNGGGGHSPYTLEVYAYPENAVLRFFVRRLGLVERYFDEKTAHIQSIASRVCKGLCAALADGGTAAAARPGEGA